MVEMGFLDRFPAFLFNIAYGELHGDNPENTSKHDIDKNAI